jgi:acyl-CoA synthetase (AMP-forming)/AMP-acid ligase II
VAIANPSLRPEEYANIGTVADVVRYHGRNRPNQIALSFEGRDTTYAALDYQSNQTANALIAAGVQPGDGVAYLGKNSDRYFEIMFAASKARAITVPIGWRLSPPEIAYLIDHAEAKVVFVGRESVDQLAAALKLTQQRPLVVAVEEGAYEAWRGPNSSADPAIGDAPGDVALLLFTSGTTGRPKGVMLTSDNLMRSRTNPALLGWNEWAEGEANYIAMPIAHIGGTGGCYAGLVNGVKNIIARDFNPFDVLETIGKERIGKMFMVPAALQFIVRLPLAREIDYSNLRVIMYGAAPMPVALLRECIDIFGCAFAQQYGMTETTGTIVYLPPEDHDPKGNKRMMAAGLPLPGVELRILSSEGEILGANQTGEIATRSLANMKGYWRNDEATAATIDADGWLRTGDAGYIDEDGYLFIADRIKDMIISGGENIYPAEVESALYEHPAIAEAAIIGVPDDTWGESVKAIVVLKPDAALTEAELIAFMRERIAAYKAPRSVDFRDSPLPRSTSGKILRRELREPYWQGKERRVN